LSIRARSGIPGGEVGGGRKQVDRQQFHIFIPQQFFQTYFLGATYFSEACWSMLLVMRVGL